MMEEKSVGGDCSCTADARACEATRTGVSTGGVGLGVSVFDTWNSGEDSGRGGRTGRAGRNDGRCD